jgi:hypothetical protein
MFLSQGFSPDPMRVIGSNAECLTKTGKLMR